MQGADPLAPFIVRHHRFCILIRRWGVHPMEDPAALMEDGCVETWTIRQADATSPQKPSIMLSPSVAIFYSFQ